MAGARTGRSLLTRLLWLVLGYCACDVTRAQQQELTPCQRCCAPGGDCSTAFKGTPGKCCGSIEGQAFCCPGSMGGGAKCYNCGSQYRCFTGVSSGRICGQAGGHHHRHHRSQYGEEVDQSTQGAMLVIMVGIVLAVIFCGRRRYDGEMYQPVVGQGKPMVYGSPVPPGMPACGYGYGGYGGYGNGYSGTAVAGSAAAGFVGGMLVNEAMSHHHYPSYGCGDYGGADYGGGGDFGGGDSGFAADS